MPSKRPATPTTPLLSRSRSSLPRPVPGPSWRPLSSHSRRLLANIPIIASIFFAVVLLVQWSTEFFEEPLPTGPPWHGPPFLLPYNISQLLGPYSPWFPAATYAKPQECNVTQVHFLQRHGARFPTKGQEADIKRALSRIHTPERKLKDSSLSFMRKYKYDLKTDGLLWFGASEAWAAGVLAYNRYAHLAHEAPPFLRASDSPRIVETAKNWRKGFRLAGRMKVKKPLLISEAEGMNNTLENSQCPNHSQEPSYRAQMTYLNLFAPPITARLNADAPGSTLQDEDIIPLMSLCPFESLYQFKTSPWCNVFKTGHWKGRPGDGTGGEWEGYEYIKDLEKFYNTGPGNPLGRPQGIGWINELIARLTNSSVNDTTQTNRTLDSNPKTFPLNRTMYVDFTHDNEMTAVIAAMGILREEGYQPGQAQGSGGQFMLNDETEMNNSVGLKREMDPRNPDPHRKWIASKVVPFAGRLVVEKLSCSVPSTQIEARIPKRLPPANMTIVDAIRVVLNDEVASVPGCKTIGGGICTLEEFLESQSYSKNHGEGEWEKCHEQAG